MQSADYYATLLSIELVPWRRRRRFNTIYWWLGSGHASIDYVKI